MPQNAPNAFEVQVTPMDFEAEGAPTAQTFHGFSLVVGNKIVARVESWSPQVYSRNVTQLWELNHNTFGRPVEIIPGIGSGYTSSCSRVELWDEEFELALGFRLFEDLTDQNKPFKTQEYFFKGRILYRKWEYLGCWLTEKNVEGYQNQGEGTIKMTANISYVNRKLRGGSGRTAAIAA